MAHYQGTARDVHAVVMARDPEGQRELAGTVGELLGPRCGAAARTHEVQAGYRFDSANEHAAGLAIRFRHQVEAFVHTVNQVDVSVAGRSEDDSGTLGHAAGSVGGEVIAAAQVGFGFDDDAGGGAVHREFADQVAGDFHGGAGIERAGSMRPEHCTMLNAKCDCSRDLICRAMSSPTWRSCCAV
jgi:hypothetical protein